MSNVVIFILAGIGALDLLVGGLAKDEKYARLCLMCGGLIALWLVVCLRT